MAYREVGMWEILAVLRRLGRGETQRQVARASGHSRKTVRRWATAAQELGWVPSTHEPDDALAAEVLAAMKPGPASAPGEVEQKLLPHGAQIKVWLDGGDGERGLRLTKVHELLRRQGVDVRYSSLHRFAIKHCGFADKRRITVRVADCEPGELAEVDFGRLGFIHDADSGRRRAVWALLVTLVHSRHQYVHVTHTQKLPDLIDGLESAWEFFGGVPARVVVDNLKAAITKPDRYDPTVQRTFEEYAQHRGIARRADGHGLRCRQRLRHMYQPIGIDPCFFCVTAIMIFAESPAIDDNTITGFKIFVVGAFHRASQINSRDHGEFANN